MVASGMQTCFGNAFFVSFSQVGVLEFIPQTFSSTRKVILQHSVSVSISCFFIANCSCGIEEYDHEYAFRETVQSVIFLLKRLNIFCLKRLNLHLFSHSIRASLYFHFHHTFL